MSFDIFEFDIVPLYFFLHFICTRFIISFISSFSKMKMKAKIYQAPKTSVSDFVMNDYLLDGLSKSTGLCTKCYSVNGNAIVFIRSPESHRWTFSHLFLSVVNFYAFSTSFKVCSQSSLCVASLEEGEASIMKFDHDPHPLWATKKK